MKINYLIKRIAWFGKYSGYECLPNYLPESEQPEHFEAKPVFFAKLIGKFYQYLYQWKNTQPAQIFVDLKFLGKVSSSDISHMLYIDYHLNLLDKIRPANKKIVGTIHLPISFWNKDKLKLLPNLSNYIILYKEEVDQFKTYAPNSTFHVIKHGVDIDFFRPLAQPKIKRNKVLFIGHYLRNLEMFYHVYRAINAIMKNEIEFHLIMPTINRKSEWLQKIAGEQNLIFHEKLSDEELLAHYQDSNVMLMPMNDSGANTAIVQGLAAGLPIITTDVGGIRSYGGGDIYPVIANNDVQTMIDLFMKYHTDHTYRDEIALKVRDFAVTELDWNIVVQQHLETYRLIQQG